ncbi:MAG: Uma2 family endonuclease [Chthoniobacterales bacterium]
MRLVSPDLAAEIVSPGADEHDRILKQKVFARGGVEELWLIEPEKAHLSNHEENPCSG